MFNSDSAVAALIGRSNPIAEWLQLNPQSTTAALQQSQRDKEAANLTLAAGALPVMGELEATRMTLDARAKELELARKATRRSNALTALSGLAGLGGSRPAGSRMGISADQLRSFRPEDLLSSLNSTVSQLNAFGNTTPDYASRLSKIFQYTPAPSAGGRS